MTNDEYERLPDLLKVREVADLLRVKPDTVHRMIKCGQFRKDEIFLPTPTSHKLIRKKAMRRILMVEETPKQFPTQKVYTISKKRAENFAKFHDEDVALGIANNYAPWRVSEAEDDGNDRFTQARVGLGFSVITGEP